jgi:nucleotide-binding universal stress UspA family protein
MSEYRKLSLKRIVVAVDFSGASYGALNYAKQLARCFSAKILLVHVIDMMRSVEGIRQPDLNLPQQIDVAEYELQKIAAGLSEDGIRYATIVRTGEIRQTVLDLVEEREADLLVIGTRGKGNTDNKELGSVAETLLRAMPCPVLTVGKYVRMDACEGTHTRRVLFPTDFSEISGAALAYTESLTKHLAGHLLLLHVNEKQGMEDNAEFEKLVKELKDPSIVTECIARAGRPTGTIVTVAAEKCVDFIVMGVHGADQENGECDYGIAFDVIREAKCPVFTLFTQPGRKRGEDRESEPTEAEEFRRQQERVSHHHA